MNKKKHILVRNILIILQRLLFVGNRRYKRILKYHIISSVYISH